MTEKHPHPPASEPADNHPLPHEAVLADDHPVPHETELEREFELERMILFSDAIFAIAITLMVIDVKWPDLPSEMRSVDLRKLLHPTIVQLVIFVISFFYVGRAWKLHLRLFRQLKKYDQKLINLNLFYLFFIVIFPFTASGLFGHTRDGFPYPYLFYIFDWAGVACTDFLVTRYIFRIKPELSVRGHEEEKKFIYTRAKYNARTSLLVFILMVLVAVLYPGNTDYLAYAFFAFPVAVMISNRRLRKFKQPMVAKRN
jgi:uncharacterized membrane protein